MTEQGKPITPRRLARMRGTLARRQPDLAIVIEDIHDAHNVSAILRSCEAVGAAEVHLVYIDEVFPDISRGVSASAQRWLDLRKQASIDACYADLRGRGFVIHATTLAGASRELYDLDLTVPTAVVFGNEQRGVSDAAARGADGSVFIPMMGMVESLNVSVACAVTLYEALRQRLVAGSYDTPRWPSEELDARLRRWLEREGRALEALQSSSGHSERARNRQCERDG
jgi:tRNA (guanosine-2'-O-)-methyltransferase